MRRQRVLPVIGILAALALQASAGAAADLYLSGDLVMSGASADASGSTEFFAIDGSDTDSSPAYGLALGLGQLQEHVLVAARGAPVDVVHRHFAIGELLAHVEHLLERGQAADAGTIG